MEWNALPTLGKVVEQLSIGPEASVLRKIFSLLIRTLADVVNTMSFSPFAGGPITMDHEHTVKAYSASPSMLGRGHALADPQGPVWVSLKAFQ